MGSNQELDDRAYYLRPLGNANLTRTTGVSPAVAVRRAALAFLLPTLCFSVSGCGGKPPDVTPVLLLSVFFLAVFGLVSIFTVILVQADNVKHLRGEQRALQEQIVQLLARLESVQATNAQLVTAAQAIHTLVTAYPQQIQLVAEAVHAIPERVRAFLPQDSGGLQS